MIDGLRVLAIIPARGGSVGVPRKNLRMIKGRPLIAWTIDAAHSSRLIDRTILSSDDEEIIQTARELGCEVPFVRPAEFAENESPYQDVILHAVDQIPDFDLLAYLNPTTPLRNTEDIDGCLRRCVESGAPACVTVAPAKKHPAWMFELEQDGRLKPLVDSGPVPPRRQDLPEVYVLNGAVSVAYTGWFKENGTFFSDETVAYPMPEERSVDVDSITDFLLVEALLDQRGSAPRER